jgi:hypothetical protein
VVAIRYDAVLFGGRESEKTALSIFRVKGLGTDGRRSVLC